ncbi:sec-independent protein translocase protein tatB-like protein [Striga asiatica]|uniref:Sec-independent protein translocase protein tatB-like protein n=1 Tax=Striga asiatica TaxID=4170 RepID=A0A5A7PBD0_STRAF|nr:sec-independent protein translocase protein tatB-like protein [Striga asiatica]
MLGISYGELFLLLGATAALIGPKDLPVIARTAGRLAGRSIGYVQVARGQFESVMQQSQARQVHKELQDTMAQLEAIRHEIRSISIVNPGPLTTRLVDNIASQPPVKNALLLSILICFKIHDCFIVDNGSAKPPEGRAAKIEIKEISSMAKELRGSDVLLEAVLEEDVARNAKGPLDALCLLDMLDSCSFMHN